MKIVTAAIVLATCIFAAPQATWAYQIQAEIAGESPLHQASEAKALQLVGEMTLDEKVSQLLNVAPAIPRLNIPAYNWWTESLHGAMGAVETTNYPEPIGLAASFDAPLVNRVASAISIEVRALHTLGRETGHIGHIGTGLDTWSPNINIFRDPRWGRGQETYGEDPFLTAQLAVAYVKGMQGPNSDLPYVISTPKHFAVHSGPEATRHVADVSVSPHDLEDTYLPAFRAAIVDGKAGSIMCAYNRINGQPACANDMLLKDHLRNAWGFKGYVVSDCDAIFDISERSKYSPDQETAVAASLQAGMDNECNGQTLSDTPGLSDKYKQAFARGLISMADIDQSLVRLFSARFRNGDLSGLPERRDPPISVSNINTVEHQSLALQSAIESIVLLKNDGTLPIKKIARIALVGPFGDATRVLRGNYSSALSGPPISILDGLRQSMPGARITLVPFTASITDGDLIPDTAFSSPTGKRGLLATYFNSHTTGNGDGTEYDATPILTRIERNVVSSAPILTQVGEHYKLVWEGYLTAPATGLYRVGMTGVTGKIDIDGQSIEAKKYSGWGDLLDLTTVKLIAGHRYPVHLESEGGIGSVPGLFWKRISADSPSDLEKAVSDADVVIAAVGLTSDLEGEEMPVKIDGFSSGDKTTLDLPADQISLLKKARSFGKPLIVVALNGSPINLSWAKDNASAIVEAWYPGQSGGLAIGKILAGISNPGGRLPLTFYRDLSDIPPFEDYSMKGRTYRYYNGKPVYRFGYGLSYTSFQYDNIKLDAKNGSPERGLSVNVNVRNAGKVAGSEVAELYIQPPNFEGSPKLALRGFQRIFLKPGETKNLTFELTPRDLSFVDRDGHIKIMPGNYKLSVGSAQPEDNLPSVQSDFKISTEVDLPL